MGRAELVLLSRYSGWIACCDDGRGSDVRSESRRWEHGRCEQTTSWIVFGGGLIDINQSVEKHIAAGVLLLISRGVQGHSAGGGAGCDEPTLFDGAILRACRDLYKLLLKKLQNLTKRPKFCAKTARDHCVCHLYPLAPRYFLVLPRASSCLLPSYCLSEVLLRKER